MNPKRWEVEFYEKPNGRCPTQIFLYKQSAEIVAYIDNNGFERLEKYGIKIGRPTVGFLRDHIWELRVNTHHGNYRLLFFIVNEYRFMITHGIKKKSGKVRDKEIDKAIEYREEYFSRHGKE